MSKPGNLDKEAGQMNAFMSGTHTSSKELHSSCFKYQQRNLPEADYVCGSLAGFAGMG